jgi:PKD repeat protein
MRLRELFRSKLENAEIVPDPSVNSKLMRRLVRREFLMFNPRRFNIYYLGGVLVAVIAAAIILSSGNDTSAKLTDDSLKMGTTVTSGIPLVSRQDTDTAKSVINLTAAENTTKNSHQQITGTVDSRMTLKDKPIDNANLTNVIQTDVVPALSKNDLLKKDVIDSDRLKKSAKGTEPLFVSSVSEGCVPLKVRFINMSGNIDSCRWTFGDGGSSSEMAPEWIFDVEGEYKIELEIFSSDKKISSSESVIKVYPRPVANFEINPEKAIIPDDEIHFINYSTDAVKYLWDFGDGSHSELFEPHHKYNKYGTYNIKLTAFTETGCTDSLLVQNAFSGSQFFIDFPNAFIPNPNGPSGGIYSSKSDESAQIFHPVFSDVSEYQLKIFSKMGILIFESNDINIGWDGYFKGQLSNSGVYIWKVRGKYRNGEPFTKMGDVTLLKN